MKRLILLITLLSVSAFANDKTVSRFTYDGQSFESENLDLRKVSEVYEDQWVSTTCEKEEYYYVKEWNGQYVTEKIEVATPPKSKCDIINGEFICWDVPGTPVYKYKTVKKMVNVKKTNIVEYPCTKKIPVLVDSVNKRFMANINFRFNWNDLDPLVRVTSKFVEDGAVEVVARNRSGSSVVLLGTKSERINENKFFKITNIDYRIDVLDRDDLLSHVSTQPSNLFLNYYRAEFEVSKVRFPAKAKFEIKITDRRTGTVLINREMTYGEYQLSNTYDGTRVSVRSLRRMGVSLRNGREYRLKVTSKVDLGEQVMLNSDVEILETSRSRRITI